MIELVITLIIIGIVTSISVPVFLNQKKQGWKSSVQSDVLATKIMLERAVAVNSGVIAGVCGPQTAITESSDGKSAVTGTQAGSNVHIMRISDFTKAADTGTRLSSVPISDGNSIRVIIGSDDIGTCTGKSVPAKYKIAGTNKNLKQWYWLTSDSNSGIWNDGSMIDYKDTDDDAKQPSDDTTVTPTPAVTVPADADISEDTPPDTTMNAQCVSNATSVSANTSGYAIDSTNFPDPVFRKYVSDHFDINHDGYISVPQWGGELSKTEAGCVNTVNVENLGITDITGIRIFASITQLDIANNPITSVNLSANESGNKNSGNYGGINLTKIFAQNTSIASFTYDYWTSANGNNAPLTYVDLRGSKLTSLPGNLKNQKALKKILLSGVPSLTGEINFSGDTSLTYVDLRNVATSKVFVTDSPVLKKLAVNGDVKLTEIWLNNTSTPLYISYPNTGNVVVQRQSGWVAAGICKGDLVDSGNGFSVCDLS